MIPDKLTAEHSENYKVSIRLMPDGLSFWGYNPSEKDSFFMETFPFDDDLTTVDAIKQIVCKHDCITFAYQSFHVACVSEKFTLASDHVFIENEKERLFDFCFPRDESLKTLAQPVKSLNARILFGIDKEVFAFLLRSLASPQFIHALSPLLVAWHKKSLTVYPKMMHVAIHSHTMDVLCVEQGNLLFANSYQYEGSHDIVYYVMYICKQAGFNQLEDHLTVSGNPSVCRTVLSVFGKYVAKVDYLQQQIVDYKVEALHAPTLDMIALMECGL